MILEILILFLGFILVLILYVEGDNKILLDFYNFLWYLDDLD